MIKDSESIDKEFKRRKEASVWDIEVVKACIYDLRVILILHLRGVISLSEAYWREV